MVGFSVKRFVALIVFVSVLVGANLAFAAGKTTVNYRPELGETSPKLDIYTFGGAKNAPVLIYVHGGAWKWGSRRQVGAKPRYYNEKGYVFVSIDYRLVPKVRVEDQLADIDQALGWVVENIGKYGGDANNLHLMGHSAGAHLVSMTAVRPGENASRLVYARALRTIISNDTLAYDLPGLAVMKVGALAKGAMLPKIYQDVFWQDKKRWRRLSPQHQIDSQRVLPAFLLLYSGHRNSIGRKWTTERFKDRLKLVDAKVSIFDGSKFSHRQMNTLIGADNGLTRAIDEFLEANK